MGAPAEGSRGGKGSSEGGGGKGKGKGKGKAVKQDEEEQPVEGAVLAVPPLASL